MCSKGFLANYRQTQMRVIMSVCSVLLATKSKTERQFNSSARALYAMGLGAAYMFRVHFC